MGHLKAFVGGTVLAVLAGGASAVQAQSLGTFTWQLQPFCNQVTVSVTQNGAIYTLDGYDDQCGAPQRAPLVGLATPNPDGSIGLGFHIATSPGGKTVSVEARISLATVGGPWTDSAGNSGTLALNGSASGSARPAPSGGLMWGTALTGPTGLTGSPQGLTVTVPSPNPSANGGALVGVWGEAVAIDEDDRAGLLGLSLTGDGVVGRTESGIGVSGSSDRGTGVNGYSESRSGVGGYSSTGTGVTAYSASGDALELTSGGIRVSGACRPVFQHTTTVANTTAHVTTLDHPLLNGDANALVFISRAFVAGTVVNDPHEKSVWYDTAIARWRVFHDDNAAMPLNLRFNVLVVKQDP
jgi:hypothetical protein